MTDRCPTDVYYEFHGMEQRDYNPIEIAKQYAPKFDKPVVDMVEVVRCKDCKHMTEHYDTDGNVPYWTCSEWDSGTDYDGYCHYGERKEANKNG